MISAGRRVGNPHTKIVASLRHLVGAHSSGYRNVQRKEAREVSILIRDHLDPCKRDFGEDTSVFLLAIELLEKLKAECVTFVRSLDGAERP